MVLANGLENQAKLAWRHLERVLEVFKMATENIIQVRKNIFLVVGSHNFVSLIFV